MNSNRSEQRRRIRELCSPTPAVKAMASAHHGGGIGADVLPNPMHIHRDGKYTIRVARAGAALDVSHVVRSSEPFQARPFVEQVVQFVSVEAAFAP